METHVLELRSAANQVKGLKSLFSDQGERTARRILGATQVGHSVTISSESPLALPFVAETEFRIVKRL